MVRVTLSGGLLLSLCWCGGATALWAQTIAAEYSDGKRHVISRGADEVLPLPDVLTLRDGRRLEAYFLEGYEQKVVFYLQEDDRFWVRHVVPREDVAGVERRQYLERDPLEPPVVGRASKQPVKKTEVLAGQYHGRRGRFGSWRLSFHSHIGRAGAFNEDATEYGTFEAVSYFRQDSPSQTFAHRVRAFGSYELFAPYTVNNPEWILVVENVAQNETDLSPRKALATEWIPQEAFVVEFSPDKSRFRLHWANIGSLTWGALNQVDFVREVEPDSARPRRAGEKKRLRKPSRGVERASPARLLTRKSPVAAPARRWRTGWSRPPSRWGRPSWTVRSGW